MCLFGLVMPFVVAVDGPSGSGKGTVSAYLSEAFSLKHIDSGLIYRFAGFCGLEKKISLDCINGKDIEMLCQIIHGIEGKDFSHPDLRKEEVASAASKIAVVPEVREAANQWMHHFVGRLPEYYKGAIVDGRDIGTVVFPSAQVKLFITADEEVRLKRRFAQSAESEGAIKKIIQERDKRDSSRKTAPLLAAKDAYIIDTTHLSLDETCQIAAKYVLNAIE